VASAASSPSMASSGSCSSNSWIGACRGNCWWLWGWRRLRCFLFLLTACWKNPLTSRSGGNPA
jgi:hypothetical protein